MDSNFLRLSRRVKDVEEANLSITASLNTVRISGEVEMWAGATAPAGWLLCDGSAVSRTTYAALFTVIGTTYGSGDGSTTFNLPNLKGKVPVGLDASQGEFDALGETGGANTHTLTTTEMPSHVHGLSVFKYNSGGSGVRLSYASDGLNGFGETTIGSGGGAAHNNLQPYIVLNYIIKT